MWQPRKGNEDFYYLAPHFIHSPNLTHSEIMVLIALFKIFDGYLFKNYFGSAEYLPDRGFLTTTKQICQFSRLCPRTVKYAKHRLKYLGYLRFEPATGKDKNFTKCTLLVPVGVQMTRP